MRNPARRTLLARSPEETLMKSRPIGPIETVAVDRIGATISENEAKVARVVLPWMTAFFAARCVTILTASALDVEAFCDERAKTRKPSSMARLIQIVKSIFTALIGARLRDDDPSSGLKPPVVTRTFVDFDVDETLVQELLERQRLITMRATKRTAFVQTRRLAILSFSAAGAFCSEISRLDYVDVLLTLAAGEFVRIGRAADDERDLLLGGKGLRAVDDYIRLRRSIPAATDKALFVSSESPFDRLSLRRISDEITYAIKATGLTGLGLSPARLHRSLSGNALKARQGCNVAAATGGYRVMPFSKPVAVSAEEMSDLIELHHPMSRMPFT
jgi:site-specific recombinase XerD